MIPRIYQFSSGNGFSLSSGAVITVPGDVEYDSSSGKLNGILEVGSFASWQFGVMNYATAQGPLSPGSADYDYRVFTTYPGTVTVEESLDGKITITLNWDSTGAAELHVFDERQNSVLETTTAVGTNNHATTVFTIPASDYYGKLTIYVWFPVPSTA